MASDTTNSPHAKPDTQSSDPGVKQAMAEAGTGQVADGSPPSPSESSAQGAGQAATDQNATDQVSGEVPDQATREVAGRGAEARELERQLEEARGKQREAEQRALENLDRWQRAQAELANFRRRVQFEREDLEKYAIAPLVAALLPVLDNFERAWQTLPGQLRRMTWLSGIDMIDRQLRRTLELVGVTEIAASGHAFDPSFHEAIDRVEGDGPPHVVEVLQPGYKLHERLLRPALVKVGPQPREEQESTTQETEEESGAERSTTAAAPEPTAGNQS